MGSLGKTGFLSGSTATGLRVTIAGTLSSLQYLTGTLGFKYIMTSRLSTDAVEHLLGIVRQSCRFNAHPSPEQSLIIVNCLSLYFQKRWFQSRHRQFATQCPWQDERMHADITTNKTDELLAQGKLDEAQKRLVSTPAPCNPRSSLFVEKCDSRLIYYMPGYVARKCVLKFGCSSCKDILLLNSSDAAVSQLPSDFTEECDWISIKGAFRFRRYTWGPIHGML